MANRIEVLCGLGMISLAEREHLEILESLGSRIERTLAKHEKSNDDRYLADALELIELYNKFDIEKKQNVSKTQQMRKIIQELRTAADACPVTRKRRKKEKALSCGKSH